MANSFVVLWTLERCRWLQRVGDKGPLEVIFGGPHTSMPSIAALRAGDRIKGVIDGQLKNNFSLQGHVRRLSAQSAELFSGWDKTEMEPAGIERGENLTVRISPEVLNVLAELWV